MAGFLRVDPGVSSSVAVASSSALIALFSPSIFEDAGGSVIIGCEILALAVGVGIIRLGQEGGLLLTRVEHVYGINLIAFLEGDWGRKDGPLNNWLL